MPITLELPTILARLADGARTLHADGTTVGDAIRDVARRFPELGTRLIDAEGRTYAYVAFYLNDEDIRFGDGLATAVNDGDELTVVSAVAGG
jgi:molybdopterin converting factor small subunit